MTTQAQLIEDVVQSVLRELRGCSQGPTAAATSSIPTKPSGLTIDDAVVTEATLAGRLSGLREVVFSARTVLTPTAKDYLRSNQISWTRSGTAVGAGGAAAPVGPKVVATHSTVAVGSAFNSGDLVRIGVKDAARVVGDAIGSGVVMVLTANPHSLAIEMNRTTEIRAIALEDLNSAATAIRNSQANCVCTKPNGRSKDELSKLARTISSCKVRV
jgi:Arc/MetJ family transcription regulator